MEAHRSYERFDRSREFAGEGEHPHHARDAALVVALIAACLAVATFLSNEAVKEVVTGETHRADVSGQFETNRVKIDVAEGDKTLLQALGREGELERPAAAAAKRHEQHLAEDLRPADRHLQAEISEREDEVEHANSQHIDYELGEVGLEVGIVLASVSIITRRRWMLVLAAAAGVIGAVLVLIGLLFA
jgi:hypothetical protein